MIIGEYFGADILLQSWIGSDVYGDIDEIIDVFSDAFVQIDHIAEVHTDATAAEGAGACDDGGADGESGDDG